MTMGCSEALPILPPRPVAPRLLAQPSGAASPAEARAVYVSGECEIDLFRRELRIDGSVVSIGGRAFEIIAILAQSAGELVSKDELIDRIWRGAVVLENTLQVHAAAIRRALGQYRGLLKTETRRGYRLLGHWTARHLSSLPSTISYQPICVNQDLPATNLPVVHGRLVGRASVLQTLDDLLAAYRVVTLTGPGGIGKTALALHIGHRRRAAFPDGVWLVEFASLTDPDLVPAAVAHVIGLKRDGAQISAETIARAVGARELLLILDNCEHVIEAAAALAEVLVRRCPQATVLATSRELLRIGGEYIVRVPPLDVPAPEKQDPEEVLEHAAVALFVSRIQSSGADVIAHDMDLQAIAAICRHLDGLPLAIEFAAAAAAALGVRQVADGMLDRFALLTRGRRTAVARHRSLRAVLDWSYALLPELEQLLLRRLAVFPGGVTLDAAAVVMRDSGRDRSAVADGLANLVAKSLLAIDTSEPPTRWRLMETIRVYALEKLARHG
jgi:predicted ATPase/DNA-binding winged helix-turn-helix (wHTH) protein